MPIFSFRWSLPPTLGCIPKQPDSPKAAAAAPAEATHGVVTLSDVPFQVNFGAAERSTSYLSRPQFSGIHAGDFRLELFPLRSPLLGESLLVFLPPLINMLKFSGWSRPIWGPKEWTSRNRGIAGWNQSLPRVLKRAKAAFQLPTPNCTSSKRRLGAADFQHQLQKPLTKRTLRRTCSRPYRERHLRSKTRWFTEFCNSH